MWKTYIECGHIIIKWLPTEYLVEASVKCNIKATYGHKAVLTYTDHNLLHLPVILAMLVNIHYDII